MTKESDNNVSLPDMKIVLLFIDPMMTDHILITGSISVRAISVLDSGEVLHVRVIL